MPSPAGTPPIGIGEMQDAVSLHSYREDDEQLQRQPYFPALVNVRDLPPNPKPWTSSIN